MIFNRTNCFGGNGGSAFMDDLTELATLRKIIIRHGAWIDSIQAVWEIQGLPITGKQHGGNGGGESHFELAHGEVITKISGRAGQYVDSLTFYTNQGRQFGPYGGNGGTAFEDIHAPKGVLGIYGRSGAYLDQVGFVLPA